MSKYVTVARSNEPGFEVRIAGRDGVKQTILGFRTEAEAEAWIRQDERLERATDPSAS